jgi:hypothetical protein
LPSLHPVVAHFRETLVAIKNKRYWLLPIHRVLRGLGAIANGKVLQELKSIYF